WDLVGSDGTWWAAVGPSWICWDPVGSNGSRSLRTGSNMLMVGVHGPKTPCEEVYVKHVGNRLYNVTYTVKEKGEYVLILRWGDDSVPGSPFRVTVP
ncbi:filamin-C-like, partial [Phasianus colchicus]|uniref:filamin-C-like n=1 Tax=Phasianus colchicus TaxID=9054 RepID=UPI00129D81F5